jgi:hypothetical protein
MRIQLNLDICRHLLHVISHGLVGGTMGDRGVPGGMCVEAAVAYATNDQHTDHPQCVDRSLASDMIQLNDAPGWKNEEHRAHSLRRAAIAQLGTDADFDYVEYRRRLTEKCRLVFQEKGIPFEWYDLGPREVGAVLAQRAGFTQAEGLEIAAEMVVQVLLEMKTEGSQYLCLTEPRPDAA